MSDGRTSPWHERVAALSATQRHALSEALAREAPTAAPERLVGFVVCHAATPPSDEELRAFLATRLPDYMVPARFVALDNLPRTAAGKLDRRALAAAQGTDLRPAQIERADAAPPVNEVEAKLVAIWRDVLKVDDVGIDDDFFEIGGDSLLSIRVIARAGREGIRISPERFFEQPTVRHMAASVTPSVAARVATSSTAPGAVDSASSKGAPPPAAVGEAPLTPIQHWFLDAIPGQRDWWNQSYVLELNHPVASETLREVTRLLVRQHDALRLRLVERDGQWRQDFPAPNESVPFRQISLEQVAPASYAAFVAAEGEREHASLRLGEGALFRVLLFEGRGGWRRLLLLGHHIVLDGVSWQVILEDLAALVTQAVAGQPLQLPATPPGASARAWALGLEARAATPALAGEADHWLRMPADEGAIPVDLAQGDNPTEASGATGAMRTTQGDAAVVTLTLAVDETRALLHEAPARIDGTAQALLLTVLLLAWSEWTGRRVLRLDLEGHGRDVLGNAVDASRTVGWFTTVFPVRLALPPADAPNDAPNDAPSIATTVRDVRRALDALPLRGAAHGLLRYLSPDAPLRARLGAVPRPPLLFNYLGTHDLTLPPASHLRVSDEASGRQRSPHVVRPYLIEINSRVQDGRLVVVIEYSQGVHRAATMEHFSALLRDSLLRIARAQPPAPALSGLDAAGLQTVADLLGELDAGDGWDEEPSS